MPDIFTKDDQRKKDPILEKAESFLNENKIIYCCDNGQFYIFEDGYYKSMPEEKVKFMVVNRFPKLSNSARSKMVENLKIISHVRVDDLNADDILNFRNGIWNAKDYKLNPHSPDIISTIRLNYDYDPNAKCPMWLEFLESCHPGEDLNIANLQEFAGYCLQRSTKLEKSLWLIGTGANGKGVFMETIVKILGIENCSFASLVNLSDESKRTVIINKLINVDSEVSKRSESFEAAFKAIVSGENININPKYLTPFSYRPFCKLIFLMNEMPRIDDMTYGFYRRVILIEFRQSFLDREDSDLKYKLKKELPGIFNWAVEGLKRLNEQRRFTTNQNIKEFLDDIRSQNNPILQFSEERIVIDPSSYVSKDEVYSNYIAWCKENNCKPFSKKRFGASFYEKFRDSTEKNSRSSKEGREYVWKGLRFKTEMDSKFEEQVPWEQ